MRTRNSFFGQPVRVGCFAVGLMVLANVTAAAADFPYGADLRFDGPQMRGTKRVPVIEIDEGGAAIIDLWCNRVEGEAVIAGDTITIIAKSRTERACPSDQMAADDDMLDALQQMTNWELSAAGVTFIGPRTLRFSFPTN